MSDSSNVSPLDSQNLAWGVLWVYAGVSDFGPILLSATFSKGAQVVAQYSESLDCLKSFKAPAKRLLCGTLGQPEYRESGHVHM